jgi:hypothetical protein
MGAPLDAVSGATNSVYNTGSNLLGTIGSSAVNIGEDLFNLGGNIGSSTLDIGQDLFNLGSSTGKAVTDVFKSLW